MQAASQSLVARLTRHPHPLADSSGGDGEGFGDLLLLPAPSFKCQCVLAAEFFPIR
jgi:hypothetical protein